ncbi:MAG: hypothetical protein EA424_01675 [Planctomycetaceae bacterium]|nr:MAG: hypothetical protein EA424_01675 [Planctomycetaceae bacterium]
MFEKLFKSKQQRELDREIAIQRALALHRQHASKLQQHERQYMEKAVRAKRSGDKVNFQRLCAMVAQTTNERRAVESQLLYFETILQTRDKVRLFKDFAGGMKAMAKSIGDVFREFDAGDMLKDVETALAQSGQLETTMSLVLDRISASQMTGAAVTDGITAEDIERIVAQQETADRVNIDKEIEAGLKAIERELT